MARKYRRPLLDKLIYFVCNNLTRLWALVYFRFRVQKSERYPQTGAYLLCSNHQSHLDPILVANSNPRNIGFVARESLFRFKPFGWLISKLGAFPINRDGGLGGIKETLRRLKRGEIVLIFPEGTRTPNGELGDFKSGFCAIARRSKVPIVPVAISGAYAAWPKKAPIPRPSQIKLKAGEPIPYEDWSELDDEELTQLVQNRVAELLDDLNPNLPDSKIVFDYE